MKNPLENRQEWQAVGAATGLGCSVVVSLLIGILGGLALDRWLGTSPLFTLIGVALGLATAGYMLYELATLGQPGKRSARRGKRGSTEWPPEADEE